MTLIVMDAVSGEDSDDCVYYYFKDCESSYSLVFVYTFLLQFRIPICRQLQIALMMSRCYIHSKKIFVIL